MGGAGVAPPPAPADVGIVAAMPIEVAPLLARLKNPRTYRGPRWSISEGECSGKVVAVVVAGMGEASARRGVEVLVAGHRPRWVVSAGFGGALDPDLRRYQFVLASRVLVASGGLPAIEADARLPGPEGVAYPVRPGVIVTLDRILRTAEEKAELRARTSADVVDMETYAVASFCAERSIPFVGLRVVSDEAGEELPPEILAVVGPTGGFRLGAAMGAFWRRPGSIKDLLRLREQANEAARRLGRAVAEVVGRLP